MKTAQSVTNYLLSDYEVNTRIQLYRLREHTLDSVADTILCLLNDGAFPECTKFLNGAACTPNGKRYTKTNIRQAIREM